MKGRAGYIWAALLCLIGVGGFIWVVVAGGPQLNSARKSYQTSITQVKKVIGDQEGFPSDEWIEAEQGFERALERQVQEIESRLESTARALELPFVANGMPATPTPENSGAWTAAFNDAVLDMYTRYERILDVDTRDLDARQVTPVTQVSAAQPEAARKLLAEARITEAVLAAALASAPPPEARPNPTKEVKLTSWSIQTFTPPSELAARPYTLLEFKFEGQFPYRSLVLFLKRLLTLPEAPDPEVPDILFALKELTVERLAADPSEPVEIIYEEGEPEPAPETASALACSVKGILQIRVYGPKSPTE